MSETERGAANSESVRLEAADWFARMHADDAEKDRASFDAWRSADPANAEAYDRLVSRWDQTAFLGGSDVGRSRTVRHTKPGFLTRASRYAMAAGVAALIVIGIATMALGRTGLFPPQARQLASHFYKNDGSRIRIVDLDDGSRVTLDGGSRIAIDFTPAERRLTLTRGRARFEVAKATDRPFVVRAGGGSVVAHGTVFDVSLTSKGVDVSLLRGSVEVEGPEREGEARGRSQFLAPGQKTSFSSLRMPSPPQSFTPAETRWTSAMLSFDGTRLAEAVTRINRYNRLEIVIGDPAIADLQITGAFQTTDPAGFAKAVAQTFQLRIEREADDRITLLSKAS